MHGHPVNHGHLRMYIGVPVYDKFHCIMYHDKQIDRYLLCSLINAAKDIRVLSLQERIEGITLGLLP